MPKTTSIAPRTEPTVHKPTSKPYVPKPGLDAEGYFNRAGCVVLSEDRSRVLLISSNGNPGKWILPAGTLELGVSPEQGALRETYEEAGVIGEIECKLGVFIDSKRNRTHYFLLIAKQEVEDYHEALFRRRAWFPLEEAAQMLTWRPVQHKVLCTYLQARPFIETLLRANTVRESCSEPLDISKFDFTRMQLDCSKDNDNDNSNGTHHPQYSCSFCLSHPTD
jgi:diphosphoinositol-polyphosphate diphosphatase